MMSSTVPRRANARLRPAGQLVNDTEQRSVDRRIVLRALRTLSTKHRQVLSECYLRGASVAEAAEALGVSRGTLKSRTHWALHTLRREIDAENRRA
jgi:RNA polymerase sigma-70 factor (ECF subfamily)